MASSPDLFVVCKKCGSEVSPYITECPYCGTRLRKRAPKLERGGVAAEPKAKRRRRPSLGRLRPGEIPGIRADRRPYGTIALVLASLVVTLGWRANLWPSSDIVLTVGNTDEYYRTLTTLFLYGQTGYEVLALAAVFLFGWLLERRHGLWAPVVVFLVGGAGGMFLAIAGDDVTIATGGNGAALALLAAWAMRDVLGRRRGRDDDSDLLAALAAAAVLILLPLASEEASALAGLGGGLIGVAGGLLLARLPER
jgi:membrane associated rhomboid family serine protease